MRRLSEEELARVIAERGYVVAWCAVPHCIGQVIKIPEITDIDSPQPFVVVAETDKNDHDEQLWMLGEEPRDFPFCSLYDEAGGLIYGGQMSFRFYRVVTD